MPRQRRGVALIVVLFLTAVLMLIVLDFAHSMQVYAMIGTNTRHDVQLRGALHAGRVVAQRLLLEDVLLDVENELNVDALDENWAGEIPPIHLEGVTADLVIEDEAGKFPLSSLVTYEIVDGAIVASEVDVTRRRQLDTLFEELHLDRELIDVLIDWLDVNDDPEPAGAESAAYAETGIHCRNGPLTSMHELELLRGFSREIVWGDPEDENALGLADVCAVTGRPDTLVNANTASAPVLVALLQADDLARRIASERNREPFVDEADLHDRVGDSGVSEFLTVASGVWAIRVTATTDHTDRPLSMRAYGILTRTRESADSGQAAVGGGPTGADAERAVVQDEAEFGVVRVTAWKEIR